MARIEWRVICRITSKGAKTYYQGWDGRYLWGDRDNAMEIRSTHIQRTKALVATNTYHYRYRTERASRL